MILPTNTDIARQRRDDMVAAAARSRLVRDARAARRAHSTDSTTARRSPLQRLLTSLRPRPVVAPAPTGRPVAPAAVAGSAAFVVAVRENEICRGGLRRCWNVAASARVAFATQ